MSRTIDLNSPTNQCDISAIKVLLAQGFNETEIGLRLGVNNETISRKITAWSKTKDFQDWIGEVWSALYTKVASEHPVEAFRQVTRLFAQLLAKRPDAAEAFERIEVSWLGSAPRANQTATTCDTTPPDMPL